MSFTQKVLAPGTLSCCLGRLISDCRRFFLLKHYLFTAKKYDWSLFIGHLVLEKILKAVFVQKNNNKLPPKTHNLLRLAEQSRIELSEEQEMLLDRVSEFNIETRYPQYKNEFYKKCT